MKFICSNMIMHSSSFSKEFIITDGISTFALLSCRRCSLEKKLADADVSEEEVHNILKQFEKKETEYMRLQRHKMSVEDFDLLTMIGKGAFGEVNLHANKATILYPIPSVFFYKIVFAWHNGFLLGQSLQREDHRKCLCDEEA